MNLVWRVCFWIFDGGDGGGVDACGSILCASHYILMLSSRILHETRNNFILWKYVFQVQTNFILLHLLSIHTHNQPSIYNHW